MARMHSAGSEGDLPPRHQDPSRHKSHLMAMADQVDRTSGSSFPRVMRTPLGALAIFLLVVLAMSLVAWLAGGPV
jgi:hypothetical protein